MQSLLERLGGRDGLTVVVAGLVTRLAADPSLAGKLAGIPRVRCEACLVDYLAAALLGESCALDGERLIERARDMTCAERAAVVVHLFETLSAAGVGSSLSQEVVLRLAGVSRQSRVRRHT